MVKADFITAVAKKTGHNQKLIATVLDAVWSEISNNLASDEPLIFRGFGTFTTKTRASRLGRNLQDNSVVTIPEKRIAVFKPSLQLKNLLLLH